MASGSREEVVLDYVHALFKAGAIGNLSDGELLDRFASSRDGAVGASFAALVERHGPMVLRVCHQTLGNAHDAQDAFQATFLVLVRRAGSIRNRDSLASWLYGVAHRVAHRARADAARRRRHERRVPAITAASTGVEVGARDGVGPDDWRGLHEEIARLPEKYRAAIVLCYFEGLTIEAAASRLGCPRGTVLSRLSRARERLRKRLTRRGVAVPAGLWAVGWARNAASSAVPSALAVSTSRTAMMYAAGRVAVGAVPETVNALTGTILRTMLMARLKTIAIASLVVGVMVAGAGMLAQQRVVGSQGIRPAGVAQAEQTAKAG
jgi:RNA polymerase sigma factor (sigma-70 family)